MTKKPIEVIDNTISHNFIWTEESNRVVVYVDRSLPDDVLEEKQHFLTAIEAAYYQQEFLTEEDLYFHLGDAYRGYISVASLFNINAKEFAF